MCCIPQRAYHDENDWMLSEGGAKMFLQLAHLYRKVMNIPPYSLLFQDTSVGIVKCDTWLSLPILQGIYLYIFELQAETI